MSVLLSIIQHHNFSCRYQVTFVLSRPVQLPASHGIFLCQWKIAAQLLWSRQAFHYQRLYIIALSPKCFSALTSQCRTSSFRCAASEASFVLSLICISRDLKSSTLIFQSMQIINEQFLLRYIFELSKTQKAKAPLFSLSHILF